MLQQRRPGAAYGPWQRWARSRVPRSVHLLRTLVPPHGFCPDFLTPVGTTDFEAGVDELLHTPKTFLRSDVETFTRFSGKQLPAWAGALADGSPQALQAVSGAVRDWYQAAIAPMHQHLNTRVEATRWTAVRSLLAEGLDAMLSRLHPTISWKPSVLELACPDHDLDIHLSGRGLRLVPSYFCGREPMINLHPDLPPVVVYPVPHDTAWSPGPRHGPVGKPGQRKLAALLGHSRATVLHAIVTGHGPTTTDLARRTGISPATVTHHTTVLRDTGLITTHRTGTTARHLPTPLGVQLADGQRPSP